MKVAISGKGGVGKTTISAMMAGTLALAGRAVIALDADPDANLGSALGLPPADWPTPLAEMKDLIAERTGSAQAYGGYFKLNPKVDDIPERFAGRLGPIRLLALGGVSRGGGGCICPASALVKALLTHLVLGRDDAVIMDMEAGIEHLGRATAQSMDAMIVVVDEGPWSVQTAQRIRTLAAELGMNRIYAVANRIRDGGRIEEIRRRLGEVPLIGSLPYDDLLTQPPVKAGESGGLEPADGLTAHREAVDAILAQLDGGESG